MVVHIRFKFDYQAIFKSKVEPKFFNKIGSLDVLQLVQEERQVEGDDGEEVHLEYYGVWSSELTVKYLYLGWQKPHIILGNCLITAIIKCCHHTMLIVRFIV